MTEKYYIVFNNQGKAIMAKPKTEYVKQEFQKRINDSIQENANEHWYLKQGDLLDSDYDEEVEQYKTYVVLVDFEVQLTTDIYYEAEAKASDLEYAIDSFGGSEDVYLLAVV